MQQRQLCDIQGRLFELALDKKVPCSEFIEAFMNSRVAACLDDTYDRLQWAGEEYILEELEDEIGLSVIEEKGELFTREVMYWTGYVYRYWHYYTGESSKEIVRVANAELMNRCWLGFHTLDVEMAIDRLKEMNNQN